MMRIYLDSNILIDALAHRKPFEESATLLLALAYVGEVELYMSAHQITDIYYILTTEPTKIPRQDAKRVIREIRPFVRPCSAGEFEVDAALDSTWDDFEDACVYHCALKAGADAIITRNKKDFEKSLIRVMNCTELFDYFKQEKNYVYELIDFEE